MKDIKGYEGYYQINEKGIVYSVARNVKYVNGKIYHYKSKIIKPRLDRYGYHRIDLHKHNKARSFLVHRLVALVFIPNFNNKPQINHKNGIKTDNCISNLEWVTNSENIIHAEMTHLRNNGEDHYNAKLNWEKVKEIRLIYNKKINPSRKLAKKYKVDKSIILDVVNYKTWKWDPEND